MKNTLAMLALCAVGCAGPLDDETASDEAALGGCTTPINCPGGPGGGPPPVDPNPIDWCGAVTGTLTASSNNIAFNAPLTLTWSTSSDRSRCTETLTLDDAVVSPSGSRSQAALVTTAYTLRLGTRVLATTTVTVPVPTPTHILFNTREYRALIQRALLVPNNTVYLAPTLDLEITTSGSLQIAEGVTLTSEQPPVTSPTALVGGGVGGPPAARPARDSKNLGPRIFSNVLDPRPIFELAGDNITLRGFRLQGPYMNISSETAGGIFINSKRYIEIDNLELSGFSGSAISISNEGYASVPGSADRIRVATDVRVHDCFIHHNQRAPGGLGYGVSVGNRANALIEHNVFDFNRHSLTSDGTMLTRYTANENLILRGGGYHESEAGISWRTQSFDVHGRDSCYLWGATPSFSDTTFNCGPAGDTYEITRNAFQYRAGPAFKLRGTSSGPTTLRDNVFAHSSEGAAISQNEVGMVSVNNSLDDTFGRYGTCDFDADGKDDLFLATGRTFWFASSGRLHWTFLKSADEKLADLQLGDFNRDGRCDVLKVHPTQGWQWSSGGSGAWVTIPSTTLLPGDLRVGDFDGDGAKDIFRRAPDGQWTAHSLYRNTVMVLQSSSLPMSALRLGDFDGNGKTDVLGINGGVLQLVADGIGSWRVHNTDVTSFDGVELVADVDDQPGVDLVRRVESGTIDSTGRRSRAQYQVLSGATGSWRNFGAVANYGIGPNPLNATQLQYQPAIIFGGTFAAEPTLLSLDPVSRVTLRRGFNGRRDIWQNHSMYER